MADRKPKQDDVTKDFARRLRELRLRRDLTQKELADRTGVLRAMIGNYEGGFHHPPLPTLRKLAHALAVSVDYLVNGDAPAHEDFQDRELLEFFAKADKLDFRVRTALKEIIHGLIVREETADKPTRRRRAA